MPPYLDIADADEDSRIDLIGRSVVESGKTVAFFTDDEPGKPERYIKKLTDRFPDLEVLGRFPGPVANVVTVKVGPKPVNRN